MKHYAASFILAIALPLTSIALRPSDARADDAKTATKKHEQPSRCSWSTMNSTDYAACKKFEAAGSTATPPTAAPADNSGVVVVPGGRPYHGGDDGSHDHPHDGDHHGHGDHQSGAGHAHDGADGHDGSNHDQDGDATSGSAASGHSKN